MVIMVYHVLNRIGYIEWYGFSMMQNQDLLQHLQELVVIHAGSQMIYPLVI